MKSSVQYKTIKVTDVVHRQLTEFVRSINAKGWQHFGVDRCCGVTISSIIEVGLEKLSKVSLPATRKR